MSACSSKEQRVSAPRVGFPGSTGPEPCRVPRLGWAVCLCWEALWILQPLRPRLSHCSPLAGPGPTAPVSSLRSGAPSQLGTTGSGGGGFRALILGIRGWLIVFFWFFFLVWSVVLIQLQAHCVSHGESSSVNRKQNVTWADGNCPGLWQDPSPSRLSLPSRVSEGCISVL